MQNMKTSTQLRGIIVSMLACNRTCQLSSERECCENNMWVRGYYYLRSYAFAAVHAAELAGLLNASATSSC